MYLHEPFYWPLRLNGSGIHLLGFMQVEVLSSVVSSVVNSVGDPTVVDVGSGQVSSIPFSCLTVLELPLS